MLHTLKPLAYVSAPKWLAIWLVIFAIFISAFAPLGIPVRADNISPVDAHTFVRATSSEPVTLDPALALNIASGEVLQNVYETLVFYDGANESSFIPQLADSYVLSGDGLTWTFHIRPGVSFHSGAGLTPSDVAYSFQRGLLQGGSSSPQGLLAEPFLGIGIDDISLLVDPYYGLYDDRDALIAADPVKLVSACTQVKAAIVANDAAGTVTMHLAQPWGPFLATIAGTWGSIMDKDWTIAQGGWDGSCNTWQYWYAMQSWEDPLSGVTNGTGPFKLDHWTTGQEIVLARNPNYWRTPASLERVRFSFVPDNAARFSMLQTGNADEAVPVGDIPSADGLVGESCVWNISTKQYDCSIVDNSKHLRRYTGRPGTTQNHLLFNFEINTEFGNPYLGSGLLDGAGIPADFFSDVHIRKAFSYCFDWDTYDQMAYDGEFIRSITLALEGMPGYDRNAPHYNFDLASCEAELGLADLDHDGIPSASDTNDVTQVGFHFKFPYNEGNINRQVIAEILSSSLAQVDPKFVIDPTSLPWADYIAAQRSSKLPMRLAGWLEDIHDPHNWYQPYLLGTYGASTNMPDSLRAQFKTLVDQGVTASTFADRHAIYQQLNQLVYDNPPLILLGGTTNHNFIQRWVSGQVQNQVFPGNYYYPMNVMKSTRVDVNIGPSQQWNYYLLLYSSSRNSYPGVDNGPVKVVNTSGDPIIASERINLKKNGAYSSYAEVMGIPASKLSDTYLFPWYNNTGSLDSQLRFGNVGTVPTTVTIKIAGVAQPTTYNLDPNESARISFLNVDNGPIEVKSSDGVPIIAALRINLKQLPSFSSYSEFLGMSAGSTASTRYIFPWYNNTGLLDSQLRFGNVGNASTTVTVKIGGVVRGTYNLLAKESRRISYPGLDNGPVEVYSSGSVPIIAAMRINLKTNTAYSSYTEIMGQPGATLSDTRYLFPWYNNTGLLDSQLRFANVGNTTTTVTVKIGGVVRDSYELAPKESKRISFPGVDSGPVEVYSSGGVPIIAALRINLKTNAVFSSYFEFMGLSAGAPLGLPGNQLSTTYWFPWYNNTGLLDSQLRFGMP